MSNLSIEDTAMASRLKSFKNKGRDQEVCINFGGSFILLFWFRERNVIQKIIVIKVDNNVCSQCSQRALLLRVMACDLRRDL